jgi:hypothetical protein
MLADTPTQETRIFDCGTPIKSASLIDLLNACEYGRLWLRESVLTTRIGLVFSSNHVWSRQAAFLYADRRCMSSQSLLDGRIYCVIVNGDGVLIIS